MRDQNALERKVCVPPEGVQERAAVLLGDVLLVEEDVEVAAGAAEDVAGEERPLLRAEEEPLIVIAGGPDHLDTGGNMVCRRRPHARAVAIDEEACVAFV